MAYGNNFISLANYLDANNWGVPASQSPTGSGVKPVDLGGQMGAGVYGQDIPQGPGGLGGSYGHGPGLQSALKYTQDKEGKYIQQDDPINQYTQAASGGYTGNMSALDYGLWSMWKPGTEAAGGGGGPGPGGGGDSDNPQGPPGGGAPPGGGNPNSGGPGLPESGGTPKIGQGASPIGNTGGRVNTGQGSNGFGGPKGTSDYTPHNPVGDQSTSYLGAPAPVSPFNNMRTQMARGAARASRAL